MGSWIAEYIEDDCDNVLALGLRRTDEPQSQHEIFLNMSAAFDVIFRWTSDSALTIAVPQDGSGALTQFRAMPKPDTANGVALTYAYYSSNPGVVRDPKLLSVVRQPVAFSYKSEQLSYPWSVICDLTLTGADGNYFEDFLVRLSASRNFAATVSDCSSNGCKPRAIPERSGADIQFFVHEKTATTSPDPTAAAFLSMLPPSDGISRTRQGPRFKTPSGAMSPTWDIDWPIQQADLTKMLRQVRNGSFDVRIGFWLDNIEVDYSNSGYPDLPAIDQFESCLSDNAIFRAVH